MPPPVCQAQTQFTISYQKGLIILISIQGDVKGRPQPLQRQETLLHTYKTQMQITYTYYTRGPL